MIWKVTQWTLMSVCSSVGFLSICHTSLKGREVTFPCPYRNTCFTWFQCPSISKTGGGVCNHNFALYHRYFGECARLYAANFDHFCNVLSLCLKLCIFFIHLVRLNDTIKRVKTNRDYTRLFNLNFSL